MLVKLLVNLLVVCVCGGVCRDREESRRIPGGYGGFTEGLMFPAEAGWWWSGLCSAEQPTDSGPGSHQLPALISGGCPEPIGCCCSPWCNIISGQSHSLGLLHRAIELVRLEDP